MNTAVTPRRYRHVATVWRRDASISLMHSSLAGVTASAWVMILGVLGWLEALLIPVMIVIVPLVVLCAALFVRGIVFMVFAAAARRREPYRGDAAFLAAVARQMEPDELASAIDVLVQQERQYRAMALRRHAMCAAQDRAVLRDAQIRR